MDRPDRAGWIGVQGPLGSSREGARRTWRVQGGAQAARQAAPSYLPMTKVGRNMVIGGHSVIISSTVSSGTSHGSTARASAS